MAVKTCLILMKNLATLEFFCNDVTKESDPKLCIEKDALHGDSQESRRESLKVMLNEASDQGHGEAKDDSTTESVAGSMCSQSINDDTAVGLTSTLTRLPESPLLAKAQKNIP